MSMEHERCRDLIDDLVDGALDAATAAAVTAHASACPRCADEIAGLRALREAAAALPREHAPPSTLWTRVRARTVARPAPRTPWLAYAAAAAVVVACGALVALRVATHPAPIVAQVDATRPVGEATFAVANPAMERRARLVAEVVGGKRMDEATRATVEHNLAVIQAALDQIDAAMQDNPNDPNLRRLLTSIHIQESALIGRMQRLSIENNRRNDI